MEMRPHREATRAGPQSKQAPRLDLSLPKSSAAKLVASAKCRIAVRWKTSAPVLSECLRAASVWPGQVHVLQDDMPRRGGRRGKAVLSILQRWKLHVGASA